MDTESDGQLPGQIGNYTFLEHLRRGAIDHVYMSMDAQGNDGVDALLNSVQSPELDSAETLRHLQLPKDDFEFQRFTQVLKEIGYEISLEVATKSRRNTREYTKAIGQGSSRALIYIPKEILVNPSQANLDSMASICSAFTKEAVLIIFSKTDESADKEVRRIVKQDWPNVVSLGLIQPWKDVRTIITDYDDLRNVRDPTTRKQILEGIKKDIENLLEGLQPLKDT